jgi:hypothetical protein
MFLNFYSENNNPTKASKFNYAKAMVQLYPFLKDKYSTNGFVT